MEEIEKYLIRAYYLPDSKDYKDIFGSSIFYGLKLSNKQQRCMIKHE